MGRLAAKHRIVKDAIKHTGTTDTGAICLALEDLAVEQVRNYRYLARKGEAAMFFTAYERLERAGINTYNDVNQLIKEVITNV